MMGELGDQEQVCGGHGTQDLLLAAVLRSPGHPLVLVPGSLQDMGVELHLLLYIFLSILECMEQGAWEWVAKI